MKQDAGLSEKGVPVRPQLLVLSVTLHPSIDKRLCIDRLHPDGISRAATETLYGGGKGNNAARALVRLGQPVIATGFQGSYSGSFITERLAGEGIQTSFVTCHQPTRTSTLIYERDSGKTFAIYEPGQQVDAEELESLFSVYSKLLEKASVVLLCGSGQSELLAGVYSRMIRMAQEQGLRCLLDSSGEALAQGIEALPYLVKINRQELEAWVGRPLTRLNDQIKTLRRMQDKGIPIAALSLGAEGMLAVDGQQVWEGKLPMENVVNVVGCGDSTLAGMAYAILNELPTEGIVRWGVACGAANTQTYGAGFIEKETVEALLDRVQINFLDLEC
jgi:tagatose 6-phosphate kinase